MCASAWVCVCVDRPPQRCFVALRCCCFVVVCFWLCAPRTAVHKHSALVSWKNKPCSEKQPCAEFTNDPQIVAAPLQSPGGFSGVIAVFVSGAIASPTSSLQQQQQQLLQLCRLSPTLHPASVCRVHHHQTVRGVRFCETTTLLQNCIPQRDRETGVQFVVVVVWFFLVFCLQSVFITGAFLNPQFVFNRRVSKVCIERTECILCKSLHGTDTSQTHRKEDKHKKNTQRVQRLVREFVCTNCAFSFRVSQLHPIFGNRKDNWQTCEWEFTTRRGGNAQNTTRLV